MQFISSIQSVGLRRGWMLTLLLLGGWLTACAPLVRDGQTAISRQEDGIRAGVSAGQTFFSAYAGLTEVRVYLEPDSPGNGQVRLQLWAAPGAPVALAEAGLPVSAVDGGGYYAFDFSAQADSYQRCYYVSLTVVGDGAVRYGAGGPRDYLNGSLYRDDRPTDGQLAFQLAYDPATLAAGLAREGLGWLGWLALLGIFFVLPGYAVLCVWSPGLGRLGAGCLAAGLSMAFYPLAMLWAQLATVRLGAGFAWLAAGLGLMAWVAWRWRRGWPRRQSLRAWMNSPSFLPDLALLVVLGLVAFTRFWAFRSLAAPSWGDSVQHTVMTQLILDHGGLFRSWEPYAPYHSLTVQYGFPAGAAVWAWISGEPVQWAVLVFGQALNWLAVAAWYPLARRLAGGNRWAGVAAVLVAGLLTIVPGYYANWGRYAQLAGQTVLPVALWITWDLLERRRFDGRGSLLLGVSLAGMLLCYYRMAFYYAGFVVVLLTIDWLEGRRGFAAWRGALASLLAAGGLLGALILPWVVQVHGSDLAGRVASGVTGQTQLAGVIGDYASWRDVTAFVSAPLLTLAGLGALLAGLRRRWRVVGLLAWTALLAAVRAASLLHVPGANMMMSTAVIYFLYAPVGMLVGYWVGECLAWLQQRGRVGFLVGVTLLAAAALWGARQQSKLMQPTPYSMVTWPDLRAAAWIRTNLPEDARFLVEGFRIYGGSTAVGSDAGWWLPLLAGRANTMPPQYALVEQPAEPGYTQRAVDLVALLEDHPPSSPEAIAALCDWGVSHVYIGQQQGLASFEQLQLFAPMDFTESPAYRLVYAQDRVRIYAFDRGLCPAP